MTGCPPISPRTLPSYFPLCAPRWFYKLYPFCFVSHRLTSTLCRLSCVTKAPRLELPQFGGHSWILEPLVTRYSEKKETRHASPTSPPPYPKPHTYTPSTVLLPMVFRSSIVSELSQRTHFFPSPDDRNFSEGGLLGYPSFGLIYPVL